MKRQYLPLYALALVVAIIGAVAVGMPVSAVLLLLVVLACPLMMMFMMGGHGMDGSHSDTRENDIRQHHDSGG
jgi:hypothetical protein